MLFHSAPLGAAIRRFKAVIEGTQDKEILSRELFSHYSRETLEKFKQFHAANPHIYEKFKELAFKMKSTGRRRYSSKMIINVLRWEMDLQSTGDEFKINDRFQSIYGRLLIYNYPEFKDFFELRIRGHGGESQ